MRKPKVKICCISSVQEANTAIESGADAIGLVSEMPSGPGVITEELVTEIAASVPKHIQTFLLTSKQSSKEIINQLIRCKTNTVQIVDDLLEGTYRDIKNELPNVKIVQVIHVNDETAITKALSLQDDVDAFLLDSGNQKLKIKELGGTGKTHDWSISKKLVDSVNKPVFLAGGIGAHNVIDAYNSVKPYGIDLCSSVRTNGKLDKEKLNNFFKKINSIVVK